MERLSWTIQMPRSFETDLVHHCGPVTAGEYSHTLQLVAIATGRKNDNRFVEQKNSTLVRAYVGYQRLGYQRLGYQRLGYQRLEAPGPSMTNSGRTITCSSRSFT